MSAERAITVLAVDDDARSRRATVRLLRQAGYRTRQAASGEQALRIVAKERPDLIVLSDDLEGARGPELARRIKGLPEGADTPILHLASAQAAPGRLPEEVQLGVDGYLTRPLDKAEFLSVTRAISEMRQRAAACSAAARQWQAAFDAMPGPVCVLDLEARFLACNARMLAGIGKTMEEILNRQCGEVLTELHETAIQPLLARMQETGARQSADLQYLGRWYGISLDPMRDPERGLIGAVMSATDITERKAYEEELARARDEAEEQRRFLEAVLNHAPGGIVVLDEQARVILSNPMAEAILVRPAPLGEDYESLAELQLLRPNGTPYPSRELPPVRAALEGESVSGAEATVVLPDGTRRELLGNTGPIRDESGNIIGAIIVFQDITERRETQKELERLLEVEQARGREAALLEAVLQNTPSAIAYVNREGRYAFVNPAYVKASGRSVEDFLGRSILEYFPQPEYQAAIRRTLETGEPVSRKEAPLELPARPEAGVTYWDFTLTPMKDDRGEVRGALLTAMEVTDKVRARQRITAAERERAREARLLTAILEVTPSLIGYVDRALCYRMADSRYAGGLGFSREGIVGKRHAELFAHAPRTTEWLQQVRDKGQEMVMREIPSASPLPGREQEETRVDITMTPVKDERGEVEGVVVFVMDVTDTVQTREKLLDTERARAALAETLNQEINHRVKNNLMMVVGLLQMQITGETDTRAAAALHDAMTRLLTFAEIHTQLRFAETEEVDLLVMTERIAEVTRRVFAKADVVFGVEGKSVPCSAKEATPLLIVVNELITNAVKHGGPAEDGKLHVEVAVRQEAENVRVSIWSSGNPPPENFDPRNQRTMGMLLTWDVIVGRYQGAFTIRPERGGTLAEVVVGYGSLRE